MKMIIRTSAKNRSMYKDCDYVTDNTSVWKSSCFKSIGNWYRRGLTRAKAFGMFGYTYSQHARRVSMQKPVQSISWTLGNESSYE
jgi:hypothetical protein